ncbi:MAG: metallophosphoesterase [Pirellulales bacterium]
MSNNVPISPAGSVSPDLVLRSNAAPTLTRRRWLKRTALSFFAAGAGVAVYTHWIEPFWVDFVERDLPIADLPPQWRGRTLVQVSDLHVGPRVSDDYLKRSFDRISILEPDVVAFTGDFVSLRPDGTPPYDQLKRVMEHLPQGKVATLSVLGNHDYGRGWSEPSVAARLVDLLRDCGLHMLRNEAVEIDGLQFVGLDELLADHCDGGAALASVSNGSAHLALCHNPDAADERFWGDYHGWILAGHTHGGQCKPPFFPPPLLPVKNQRYTAGEFDLFDGRLMYINRGLGHLQRVRFNVRPEVTVFRLVAAQ